MYGKRKFQLDAETAIYRQAHDAHVDTYQRETVCVCIRLPPSQQAPLETFAIRDEQVPSVASRLSAELDAYDHAAELSIEGLSAELVGRVRSKCEFTPASRQWIRQVRDRIEDEYAEPPTLAAIAAGVGREASYVATAFRRAYGKSVGDHLRDVRLWRTRKLLEDRSLSLAEVAQRGGFADQSHFARLFKRRFAMTPGEYRRRALRLSDQLALD